MRTLIILALVIASPMLARAESVIDTLPTLATIVHGNAHVVVRGELSASAQRDALRQIDQVIADVERRFIRPRAQQDPQVTVCLLPGDQRFLDVASRIIPNVPSLFGFYKPDTRVAVANLGASIGNLRHELVHPLIDDDFPKIPAWLTEGIASLYGNAHPTGRGFEFVVNGQLRDLQAALRAGTLPTIAQLAASTETDVHGATHAIFYAMARYVLLYVDRHGKLGELYAALRDASPDQHRAILERYVDDRSFAAWASQLHL